jgi:hypothetical protein
MKGKTFILMIVLIFFLVGCSKESIYDSVLINNVTIDKVETVRKINRQHYYVYMNSNNKQVKYELKTESQYDELKGYIESSEFIGIPVKSDIIVNWKTHEIKGIALKRSQKVSEVEARK